MKTTTVELTDRELALVMLIRGIEFGTLDTIGVQDGQPSVVVGTKQRIDLLKDDERRKILSGGFVPIPRPKPKADADA